MSEGFLGRWSRRKLEVKQGKVAEPELEADAVPAPVAAPTVPPPRPSPTGGGRETGGAAGSDEFLPPLPGEGGGGGSADQPASPTLDDVRALTAESDFARFAAPDVAPEVKNAALKKLFADPRYNVMDGLDVYVDDYSKPDPVPATMLRQLASAAFLGLFDEQEREQEAARRARDVADNPTAQSVAQSGTVLPAAAAPPEDADPDLRLQQDHAAPGEDPGRGTG